MIGKDGKTAVATLVERMSRFLILVPWERGSNENLNRIVREYFPKGTPISSDPKYLAMVACDINDRPRKIHNWKKPSELFTELVESNASTG